MNLPPLVGAVMPMFRLLFNQWHQQTESGSRETEPKIFHLLSYWLNHFGVCQLWVCLPERNIKSYLKQWTSLVAFGHFISLHVSRQMLCCDNLKLVDNYVITLSVYQPLKLILFVETLFLQHQARPLLADKYFFLYNERKKGWKFSTA